MLPADDDADVDIFVTPLLPPIYHDTPFQRRCFHYAALRAAYDFMRAEKYGILDNELRYAAIISLMPPRRRRAIMPR